jgi:hypothetical protein
VVGLGGGGGSQRAVGVREREEPQRDAGLGLAAGGLERHVGLALHGATAMKKWRIVILGFGTARQKMVLE